jgi:DNA-binding transcriptional LysR family regulator
MRGEAPMSPRRGQMLYFVTVVEEGQFTRAAEKLHIAQPALSKSIAQLEHRIGVRLLERHARGVALTPAGEAFYEKARVAVAAEAEALATAEFLMRGQQRIVEWGFVVAPPGLHSPGPLKALADAHRDIDIRYLELSFPTSPTHTWLADVDVAVCHVPQVDPRVWSRWLYREPRVVVAAKGHPLAARGELTVADVLDEAFVGFHPSIEPTWAGFWSLDDHRGGPPRRVTVDRAANGQEILASLAVRSAITTAPASVAEVVTGADAGVITIPLLDARPSDVVLVGREDRRSGAVEAVLAFLLALGGGSAGTAGAPRA